MAELTNKLIEMHQRVVVDLQARLNALTLHNHQVEHLCNEQQALLHTIPWEPVQDHDAEAAWYKRCDAADEVHRTLFGEEKSI